MEIGISEEGLWSEVLRARYGTWRKLDVTMIHRDQSMWWQIYLGFFVRVQREIGNWFDGICQWTLGDGRHVKFWNDRWTEGQVLKEKF